MDHEANIAIEEEGDALGGIDMMGGNQVLLADDSAASPSSGGEMTVASTAAASNTVQATIYLLIIIHAVFLYQYYTNKKANASYKTIIVEGKFYLLFVGMVSHITTSFVERQNPAAGASLVHVLPNNATNNNSNEAPSSSSSPSNSWRARLRGILQRPLLHLRRRFNISTNTTTNYSQLELLHLIPDEFWLMAYCTHLIWQFRALEELFGGAWLYSRTILVLGTTSCFLELLALHCLSKYTHTTNNNNNNTINRRARHGHSHTQAMIIQSYTTSPRCGLTSITSALLLLFSIQFPLIRIPILPTLGLAPFQFLFLHRMFTGDVGFICCFLIVYFVSRRTHPLGSTAGFISGSLYYFGGMDWLVQDNIYNGYWFAWFVMLLVSLCAVSLKVHGVVDVVCIDYVNVAGTTARSSTAAGNHNHNRRQRQAQQELSASLMTSAVIEGDDNDDRRSNGGGGGEEDEYIDLETGRTISNAASVDADAVAVLSEDHHHGGEMEPLIERNRDD